MIVTVIGRVSAWLHPVVEGVKHLKAWGSRAPIELSWGRFEERCRAHEALLPSTLLPKKDLPPLILPNTIPP